MVETTQLKIGSIAPDFTLKSSDDKEVTLSEFRNKSKVILAFYPKDDTPGCTKEMCQFSENLVEFESKEYKVFGISLDNIDSHNKFITKYGLKQTLLSDHEGHVANLYGALSEGKKNANRVLYIIDKSGKIEQIIEGMPDIEKILNS